MSRFSLSRPDASGRIGARIGQNVRRPRRDGVPPRGRAILLAGIGLAALLVFAWIDGGEEPIRPIVQSVSLAESAR